MMPSDERLRELAQRMSESGISYMDTTARHEVAAACRAVIAARAVIAGRDHPIPTSVLRAILGPATGGGDE